MDSRLVCSLLHLTSFQGVIRSVYSSIRKRKSRGRLMSIEPEPAAAFLKVHNDSSGSEIARA